MKAMKLLGRPTQGSALAGLACVAMIAFVAAAFAGTGGPTLTLTGGTGVPGGTVAVTLSISGSQDEAASAAVDVQFDGGLLDVQFGDCAIDPRIADTHQLGGRVSGEAPDQVLVIDVFVQPGTPGTLPPVGDGELATCQFGIRPGVPAGTTTLMLADPLVADGQGTRIPGVQLVDGVIAIGVQPTPTPTPTNTPQSTATNTPTRAPTSTNTPTQAPTATNTPTRAPSATDTPTQGPTATNTPTRQPTATNTIPPTATATSTPTEGVEATVTPTRTRTSGFMDDDGCAVVPTSRTNPLRSLILLLAPALLLWGRRRRF